MLQLSDQATAIVTQLKTITTLAQVDYVESNRDTTRRPYMLPMAQVVLSKAVLAKPGNRVSTTDTAWAVIVVAKDMVGENGLLDLVDAVLEKLSGFTAVAGMLPLVPASVEYIERVAEAASYSLIFTTSQQARFLINHTR